MATLETILIVVFIIICIALTVIVLMQEGKSAGLGAVSGAAESYWGKNKGRSIEGTLEKVTKLLVIGFFVIAIALIPVSSKADEAKSSTTTQDNSSGTNNNSTTSTTTPATSSPSDEQDTSGESVENGSVSDDAASGQ